MNRTSIVTNSESKNGVWLDAKLGPADGAAQLLRLAELLDELNAIPLATEARELATRLSEGRFYVACVGQLKRSKSTLI
jgi:hypothetical protein